MNPDERTFLNAICAQPEDDTARLVFADWLAENGDPDRGEFIRCDVELARTPPGSDNDERRRRVLLERRDALFKKHKAAWLAPFSPFATAGSFVRGFVQSLEVQASTFLQHAEKWFAITPLTKVTFTACRVWDPVTSTYLWWTEQLFASPLLSRLRTIDLESLHLNAMALAPFTAHPDLSRLRELLLASNDIHSEGAIMLARMPQLKGLEALDLRGNGITDTGARAIARSEHLAQLRELRISHNSIRARAWDLLKDKFGDALGG
jgi:uncharacterized protein (TIGR02996 family)